MSGAVAALMEAATDGVDFDGLVVENGTYGYRFETPETSARGIDAGELAELADGDPYVANWRYWEETVAGHGTARRAFLRWLEGADAAGDGAGDGEVEHDEHEDEGDDDDDEGAPSVRERMAALRGDGVAREWGELRIRARLGDAGERVYDVRHVEDADADARELDTHRDPLDARELTKHDDAGKYRPLSTAPSLSHGWRFVDLDGNEVVETVEFVYPATVANWHRERRGELDVTHWRETADRQTGIYAMVEELDEEAVAWAAEACCADSQCLKRREWEYDEATDLGVPGGDGVFPCREPCSLFVAAARTFAKLEREEEHTYEFTLTGSERVQLDDLLDAVADGRAEEIREADLDDGANRYRARYLRAKRDDQFE